MSETFMRETGCVGRGHSGLRGKDLGNDPVYPAAGTGEFANTGHAVGVTLASRLARTNCNVCATYLLYM